MRKKTSSTHETAWFGEGLRFGCRRCGSCCTGDPGYVFLRPGEAARISAFMDLGGKEFRKKFTRKVNNRRSLREEKDGRCVLFGPEGCRIYQVRPLQCRVFPFWLWNVARREHWEALARECPGIGKGRLYTREEIEGFLAEAIE